MSDIIGAPIQAQGLSISTLKLLTSLDVSGNALTVVLMSDFAAAAAATDTTNTTPALTTGARRHPAPQSPREAQPARQCHLDALPRVLPGSDHVTRTVDLTVNDRVKERFNATKLAQIRPRAAVRDHL